MHDRPNQSVDYKLGWCRGQLEAFETMVVALKDIAKKRTMDLETNQLIDQVEDSICKMKAGLGEAMEARFSFRSEIIDK